MQEYLSKTERIKEYIKEVLSDGTPHKTKKIIEHVDQRIKEDGEYIFQINSYVNAALRLLIRDGEYAKVSYGTYQKGGIPYIKDAKEQTKSVEKEDFKSVMSAVKAFARGFNELFSQKTPFTEMDVQEESEYWAIKTHSLQVAKELKANADRILELADSGKITARNEVIKRYFKEALSDGKPHKMNDIKDYIISKMVQNGEYNGERSTSFIYPAIQTIIENEGSYRKVARGIYQMKEDWGDGERNTVYSMSDVSRMLDRGFNLSEKNIIQRILNTFAGANEDVYKEAEQLASKVSDEIESCIDNVSYMIAFGEDYMDRREKMEEEKGMTMSGM